MRWLVALLSDTGMRLGEAVGLAITDINLDGKIPHINLIPHPWRRLKTKGSEGYMFHWLEKPCGQLLGRLRVHLEVVSCSLDITVVYLKMPTPLQLLSTSG